MPIGFATPARLSQDPLAARGASCGEESSALAQPTQPLSPRHLRAGLSAIPQGSRCLCSSGAAGMRSMQLIGDPGLLQSHVRSKARLPSEIPLHRPAACRVLAWELLQGRDDTVRCLLGPPESQ